MSRLSVVSRLPVLSVLLFSLSFGVGVSVASPRAEVSINGSLAATYFNDGDSFRVLSGRYQDTKARLSGYNTLESFGPVHRWGTWHARELYYNAKMATTNATRGRWSCDFNGERDTYGRGLFWCQDLATDQVRQGLAHAMSVDQQPARPELIAAQREAISARRGMWAQGVPDYVLTSLHSTAEDPSRSRTYNRLVSTRDGHSEKWLHQRNYEECEWVCAERVTITPEVRQATINALRAAPELSGIISAYQDDELAHISDIWLRIETISTRAN